MLEGPSELCDTWPPLHSCGRGEAFAQLKEEEEEEEERRGRGGGAM